MFFHYFAFVYLFLNTYLFSERQISICEGNAVKKFALANNCL